MTSIDGVLEGAKAASQTQPMTEKGWLSGCINIVIDTFNLNMAECAPCWRQQSERPWTPGASLMERAANGVVNNWRRLPICR